MSTQPSYTKPVLLPIFHEPSSPSCPVFLRGSGNVVCDEEMWVENQRPGPKVQLSLLLSSSSRSFPILGHCVGSWFIHQPMFIKLQM